MTLHRFNSKRSQGKKLYNYQAIALKRKIFTKSMEKFFVEHIKQLAFQFHELSQTKCKELSYELPVKNKVKTPSNLDKKPEGR